jgi:DNA modification methylase
MKNLMYSHRIDTHQILVIGDCLEVLKDEEIVPKNSITLTVTSPPYGLGKEYGGMYSDKFDLDAWLKMINQVSHLLYEVTAPNGSFFLNISPIPDDKDKEIVPLDSYAFFEIKKQGFHLRNKIIWNFNNMQNPIRRLAGRWEAILWFVKDIKNYIFNLDDIRIPYITVGDKRIKGNGRNPTDVWYFDRVNNMTKAKLGIDFPAVYPEPMIERILRMSSNKGDWVLDPFLGSGTTMRVAKMLGRNSIGIEINPKNVKTIKKRVEPEKAMLDGLVQFKEIHYAKKTASK